MPPFSLCRYRGQKTRFAEVILSHMPIGDKTRLWDVCAGSGAVALAAAARGVPAKNITLVERGAWGLFWTALASGTFDLARFQAWLDRIPIDQHDVPDFMRGLFAARCSELDAPYVFFLLQAASVHGSAFGFVQEEGGVGWTGSYSCAKYFVPTETSVRRYPTRVMPLPEELMRRVRRASELLRGATVIHGDVAGRAIPLPGTVMYVDPPYPGTKGYATDTAVEFPRIQAWVRKAVASGCVVYVSGYEEWEDAVEQWDVGGSRMGGGGRARTQRRELLMRLGS